VSNSLNWILLIVGVLAFVAEVVLGAATGFDLALLGASLAAGGAVGLLFGSPKVGLFAAGVFAFSISCSPKAHSFQVVEPARAVDVDALLGKSALVTERIGRMRRRW
jgi:membrane protein implicated in regulation of membrane protease activity